MRPSILRALRALRAPRALVALAVVAPATSRAQSTAPKIPFERYTLPSNGLTVILSEDHSTPMVTVDVWYHVGSKNEIPGKTGFAHLFEHVMFTGSGHVPYGVQDRLTEGVGGPPNNGSTTNDRTNYYETVPSNYLEAQFWIESDKMGWLLDALDVNKLNAQRDIVKNERRQGVDNQPYGRSNEIITAALYPATNPYSWPVVGSMTDLSAASADDVKNFFRLYYAPNNATITVVGDFDSKQAKAAIAKYFADIPRGKTITRPSVPLVKLPAEKRLVYEDRVQLPRLYMVWPTVGVTHQDAIPLSVLSSILSGTRTRRLNKALVYDQQAAAQVSAFANSNESAGTFNVQIVPRPGHSLTELETTTDSVLARIKRDGPTAAEVEKVKANLELGAVATLESGLGRAETLANGSVFFNDPEYYRKRLLTTAAVTAAEVKRVANTYLTNGRVVLSIVPIGKTDQASKPEASTKVGVTSTSKSATEAR
jgi:zinc protease